MSSIIPDFQYDIFISYRHNDNRSGWVTDFVDALQQELAATIKEPISIYFDKSPHDGLLETHSVDKSLEGKLKCLIFIPIISQTYCDPRSFAWQHEFCAFNKLAKNDQFGRDIKLSTGNVASRILPIKIHHLDAEDKATIESEIGGVLRPIEFIFKSPGVNRPLLSHEEHPQDNHNKTFFRDQINKVANAIKELIVALKNPTVTYHARNAQPATRNRSTAKTIGISALILIFILIGILAYQKLITSNQQLSTDKSIAVLPFVNMSNDPKQEYFSDGITEEIVNTLVKIKDLKVAGRTSSFQYKGKNEDLKTIGKALGVAYIMEGSVRKTNDEVRITAQVINAENGFHLWSNEYMGPMNDVFHLQEQVSIDIARTLSDKLGVSELSILRKKNINTEAFDYFLKGRHLFMKREKHDEMRQFFRRAIEADSTFDQAYSSLAGSFVLFGSSIDSLQIKANLTEAEKFASKALIIDSLNSEAYAVMGSISDHQKNFVEARQYFEKAISLNPGSSTVNLWFGQHLYRVGHLTEAFHYVEKATSIEPFYPINYQWLANISTLKGDIEMTISQAKKATLIGDDGWGAGILACAYLEIKQTEKVQGLKTDDRWVTEWMDALVKKDTIKLQGLLGATRDMEPFEYVYIGNHKGAMRMILKNGHVEDALGKYRKELRNMPGFKEAVVKFGFDNYWKKYGGPDVCPDIVENNLVCD